MRKRKKPPIGERKCLKCSYSFAYYDSKSYYCDDCRDEKQPCKCGCGQLVKVFKRSGYAVGHRNKGKTYLEIYSTSTPKCGTKRGEENHAKRPETRKKISEGGTKKLQGSP